MRDVSHLSTTFAGKWPQSRSSAGGHHAWLTLSTDPKKKVDQVREEATPLGTPLSRQVHIVHLTQHPLACGQRNMSPTGKGSDAQGWDYEAARFDDIDQDTIRRTPTPQHDKLALPSPTFDVANCVEEPDISDLDLELAHDASPVPEDDELSLLTLTLQPPLSSSTARVGLSDLAIDPAKLETMLTSKGVSCEVRDNYTVLLTAIKYPALAYDKIVIEQQGVFRIDHKTKARSLVCRGRPTTANPSVATTATATTPVGHALPPTIAEQRRQQGEDRPSLDTMLAMHAAWADDNKSSWPKPIVKWTAKTVPSNDRARKRRAS